jgi:hypothetical protein
MLSFFNFLKIGSSLFVATFAWAFGCRYTSHQNYLAWSLTLEEKWSKCSDPLNNKEYE